MSTHPTNFSPDEIFAAAYGQKPQVKPSVRVNDDDDEQEEVEEGTEEETTVPHEERTEPNQFDSSEECLEDDEFDDEAHEEAIFKPIPAENKGVRARRWFITYFTGEVWKPDFDQVPSFRYAVYTREIAPTTGAVHYHCYLELTNPNTMQWVKNRLNIQSANLSVCKGTVKQNIMYCTKKRTRFPGFVPVHVGKPSEQGNRTDLDWIAEAIMLGATHHELLVAGRGNVFRYGNMVNLAQKTVNSENEMDLLIHFNRKRAASGMPPITLKELRENPSMRETAVKLSREAISGAAQSTVDLQEALSYVALGQTAGNTSKVAKPSEEAKGLRKAVKKEASKTTAIKAYKKPLGAYFIKIRDDFNARSVKWINQYLDSNPFEKSGQDIEKYMTEFEHVYGQFVQETAPQYCDNRADVTPLLELLDEHIGRHIEGVAMHIAEPYEE